MNPRARLRAVYEGVIPDQVPLILDLSHWYKKNNNVFFDLNGFTDVEWDLVTLHQKLQAVCYLEMGRFYQLYYDDSKVKSESWTDNQGVYHYRLTTPVGTIEGQRIFEKSSYSYNITKRLLNSVDDFAVVNYLMDRCQVETTWERYDQWSDALGEVGFPYCQLPYSGLGYLISLHFGVEKTCLAMCDYPDQVHKLVQTVNNCNLRILDAILDGPAEVIFISDNFDSNIQNPRLFNEYSRDYYTEVARRVHAQGKYLAVHVDGEMRGCLANFAQCGVDAIDAATPFPMFSLTPQQARSEAGNEMILSGGIPATVFGSQGTDAEFAACVKRWLDTRHLSARLIMAAGDQVPTDAPWHRLEMLPDLVAQYGSYG